MSIAKKIVTLAGVVCLTVTTWAVASDPIVIGVPTGLSGANSTVAPAVVQSSEMAVAEINESGGILGRQVKLEIADDGSGASGAQRAFDDLIINRNADVIISMETSAARNAGIPIVERNQVPYIYTSLYEGRSCSPYLFANGAVPEQMVGPIVDYFIDEKASKRFFLVGSDYAFGRGMLEFTRNYIEERGGEVVAEEYQPMNATDWTSIISQMRREKPDAVIMSTAGGAPNVTLQRQYKAAGMQALVGNLSVDELTAQSMGADAEGIYISASYLTAIKSDVNSRFLERMETYFGSKLLTPNDLSVPQYDAIYLYKAAVEMAGTTDADAVIEALAKVSFDGPRGTVQMSAQRHAPLTMHLGRVQGNGSVEVVQIFKNVDPGEQCPTT
ncbi:amino acid ABC transporter [Marinobacter psychrophilus]|jgi:urea transport system substrate-binding protein|uniref:Amino acid ABC transporter n=1 Tax=Marinobacter psychrophilus TaxID=330734 RepID=A0A0H4I0X6_9GAMM|nr:substrate-binding protein [Marinobacter psychrophilus]AKO52616.1 amino acid ABC transporter [Marinobacter psychrophilus]